MSIMETSGEYRASRSAEKGIVLVNLEYRGTMDGPSDVRVYLSIDGKSDDRSWRSQEGDLDAIAKAINFMFPHRTVVVGYRVTTKGTGTNAVAHAAIVMRDENGKTYIGEGEHPKTMIASVIAYIDALNKLKSA